MSRATRCTRPLLTERSIAIGIALASLLGAGWVVQPVVLPTRFQREIHAAAWALGDGKFDMAWTTAHRALEIEPNSASALLLAGSSAAGRFDDRSALSFFERIPRESPQAFRAELGAAERWLRLGRVAGAEQAYRRILAQDPGNVEANRKLARLLQGEGRSWESLAFLAPLIYQGVFTGEELLGVVSTERYFRADPALDSPHARSRQELVARLGDVRRGLLEGRDSEVEPLLREIVLRHPDVAESRARLGRLIFETGQRDDFLAWNAALTPDHERHPETWFVRGLFAVRENGLPEAVRCFLETLLRSPNHLPAHHQISRCLLQLGQTERAREFSDRIPVLFRIDVEANLMQKAPNAETAARLIGLLEVLGRRWEAAGWAHLALRFGNSSSWLRRRYFELCRSLSATDGLTSPDDQPALRIDKRDFPLPSWSGPAGSPTRPRPVEDLRRPSTWHFTDDANSAALDFAFYDGTTPRTRMRHVIETLGGGIGAFDFDGDGWPDLYCAQGNNWRSPVADFAPIDRLFRNTGDGRFVDVTDQAGLQESGFTHGVAAGDYDNDGWPDIYVANLGPNRLYHNNGDGTFADVSAFSGTQGDEWSASCALADVTGDGLPDLFVVNYLDRDYVVNHPCFYRGIEVGCTPDSLPPARNRVYMNLGDGRFVDVSAQSGVLAEAGNGLGLVIADFRGCGRPDVFVGNDTTPNFLFRNSASGNAGIPHFREEGVIAGVAFNAGGSFMASMGIAAGDANGDGRLDLFVTTYMNDADVLFVQQPDGLFVDETRRARLYEPTVAMLGFGSQFLDVDNDGWEDLVTTNGHVTPPAPDGPDDERDKMPSQVFANLGNGAFVEVSADLLGPFFQKRALGRGLAELDWNRDGRQDFCVSHIHAPTALLTNCTESANHRLIVHLVGTRVSRDAYGAVGVARVGERRLTRHLTAGGGYLVTNQRRLWFGLGPAESVDELMIVWPGGAVQRFERLPADCEVLLIEGQAMPSIVRRYDEATLRTNER